MVKWQVKIPSCSLACNDLTFDIVMCFYQNSFDLDHAIVSNCKSTCAKNTLKVLTISRYIMYYKIFHKATSPIHIILIILFTIQFHVSPFSVHFPQVWLLFSWCRHCYLYLTTGLWGESLKNGTLFLLWLLFHNILILINLIFLRIKFYLF